MRIDQVQGNRTGNTDLAGTCTGSGAGQIGITLGIRARWIGHQQGNVQLIGRNHKAANGMGSNTQRRIVLCLGKIDRYTNANANLAWLKRVARFVFNTNRSTGSRDLAIRVVGGRQRQRAAGRDDNSIGNRCRNNGVLNIDAHSSRNRDFAARGIRCRAAFIVINGTIGGRLLFVITDTGSLLFVRTGGQFIGNSRIHIGILGIILRCTVLIGFCST